MLTLAALLLAPPSAPAPPPGREMLDAFKAACSRTGDVEAMKADAVRSGWTPIAPDAHPQVGRLVKMGREAVAADGTSTGSTFRRTLGGRELFLIVSRYDDKSGYWGVGCRLYDLTAVNPVDGKVAQAWMGRPPTGVQESAPGLSKRLWEPGWRDGITVEVSHVPQNHPLEKTWGLSGNVLVAQAIGGF